MAEFLTQCLLLAFAPPALWLAFCIALLPLALVICGPRMLYLHFRYGITWKEIHLIDIWSPAEDLMAEHAPSTPVSTS